MGNAQRGTSVAWCGTNVVVTFSDSGSVIETLANDSLSTSLIGWARSSNGGVSFTDLGALSFPGTSNDTVGPRSSVVCSDSKTFHVAAARATINVDQGLALFRSTDGAQSFSSSQVITDAGAYFDEPSLALDPTNPLTLYLAFTQTRFSFAGCAGGKLAQVAVVKSIDGGTTWSPTPTAITSLADSCQPAANRSPRLAVDNVGSLYVAYHHTLAGSGQGQIRVQKSTTGGGSFQPWVPVATLAGVGAGPYLQGGIFFAQGLSLAVDRSIRGTAGPVYLAWEDGTSSQADALLGSYLFADIFVSQSPDGTNWSTPSNLTPATPTTDQFRPALAVDRSGTVATCYYDRRPDPSNAKTHRSCSKSRDRGVTWRTTTLKGGGFVSVVNQDGLVDNQDIGDSDGLASDFTGGRTGFVGGYEDTALGTADVKINRP